MKFVKLGILITEGGFGPMVIPILKAALERGDEVRVFLMDDGCYMSEDPEFLEIAGGGVKAGMCDLNRGQRGLPLPEGIQAASQYDNISMARWCDRLLVF